MKTNLMSRILELCQCPKLFSINSSRQEIIYIVPDRIISKIYTFIYLLYQSIFPNPDFSHK